MLQGLWFITITSKSVVCIVNNLYEGKNYQNPTVIGYTQDAHKINIDAGLAWTINFWINNQYQKKINNL